MTVETAKVEGRRKLDYKSYAELLADADKLSSGPINTLGNWSAGQIFVHLAKAYKGAIDGFPFVFPWYFRDGLDVQEKAACGLNAVRVQDDATSCRLVGTRVHHHGDRPGRASCRRGEVRAQPNRATHPIFGNLSKEEYDTLNLKHASMHMSFLVPA